MTGPEAEKHIIKVSVTMTNKQILKISVATANFAALTGMVSS